MQFDVYPNPSPRSRSTHPYLVDVQSDLLDALPTRLVVPLVVTQLAAASVPKRLCPLFTIQGQTLMALPFEAAPLPKRLLTDPVDHLGTQADELISAMDTVLSGV